MAPNAHAEYAINKESSPPGLRKRVMEAQTPVVTKPLSQSVRFQAVSPAIRAADIVPLSQPVKSMRTRLVSFHRRLTQFSTLRSL